MKSCFYDVVLMDVQMPGIDGLEATRQFRQYEHENSRAALPIIGMTAHAMDGYKEKCLKIGMNDYISKPIYPEILYSTMLRWHTRRTPTSSIISPTKKKPAQESSATSTKALSRLYQISGLDVDQALERLLNNETLYLKLIKRFLLERSDIVDVMEAAIAEKNIKDALYQAHSFKSLAGTIGAVELQALALQIELELQQEKTAEALLYALRSALNTLMAELRVSLNI